MVDQTLDRLLLSQIRHDITINSRIAKLTGVFFKGLSKTRRRQFAAAKGDVRTIGHPVGVCLHMIQRHRRFSNILNLCVLPAYEERESAGTLSA